MLIDCVRSDWTGNTWLAVIALDLCAALGPYVITST